MLSYRALRVGFRKAYLWVVGKLAGPVPRHSSSDWLCFESVLRVIFYSLDFWDLVAVSQVCSLWRRIAEDHPLFWQYVRVDTLDACTLEWAKKCLNAGRFRPFTFEIDLDHEHPRVEKVISLIAAHLGSVRELVVRINSIYALSIWCAMERPAPALEFLEVQFYDHSREGRDIENFPLPPWMFHAWTVVQSQRTSRLSSIVLINVTLPSRAPLAPMPSVVDLTLFYSNRVEFPSQIYVLFPNLRRLILGGCEDMLFTHPLSPPLGPQLEFLDVQFNGEVYVEMFKHFPVESVTDVRIWSPSEESVYAALNGLRDPFQLSIYAAGLASSNDGRVVVTSVRSLRSNYSRHFAQPKQDYYQSHEDSSPNALLDNELFAEQVTCLVLATSLWSLVHPYLPSFIYLSELVVFFDNVDAMADYLAPLPYLSIRCPNLSTLTLESPTTPVTVDVSCLAELVGQLADHNIEIRLVRVHMVGDPTIFQRLFGSYSMG